jgi:hypothetical protein
LSAALRSREASKPQSVQRNVLSAKASVYLDILDLAQRKNQLRTKAQQPILVASIPAAECAF